MNITSNDDQNTWISDLRNSRSESWFHVGLWVVSRYGLAGDYRGIYRDLKIQGASEEHAVKRALRELQLEHDLDYVADIRTNAPEKSGAKDDCPCIVDG
jgi:hypothetical protein